MSASKQLLEKAVLSAKLIDIFIYSLVLKWIIKILEDKYLPILGDTNFLDNMKAIIFNDKENSDRSMNRLNKNRQTDTQRFWKIKLFHDFIFQKVGFLLKKQCADLELVKAMIYTGEYNAKALNNVKRSCGSKIKEMNALIAKEDALLNKVTKISGHDELKEEVIKHVNSIKQIFQDIKDSNIKAIEQQSRNVEGQKKLFDYIKNKLPFIELRTTPLVTRQGIIQQKGVDAKFSTDLILLAQSNAFDVAILLSGDADVRESIKLIRERYGKLVFLVAYYSQLPEEKHYNTISDELLYECDYFINLYDLSEQDISKISVLKEAKPSKEKLIH